VVFHFVLFADGQNQLRSAFQRRPGGQRVHVVSPMDDLSVLERDDRNEPVVVGNDSREDRAVYFVFEDYNATVLSMVYNKSVG
jgi:hypothetical protein